METFVNKVAESGIITINLEDYLPKDVLVFDLKQFLFMELILKEKDYRAALLAFDWSIYEHKIAVITCTADAIIPVWAYMLAANYLQSVAQKIVVDTPEKATELLLLENINNINLADFTEQRVVIKGCGEIPISASAYATITAKLKPVVKSIMYGEPCSTVPIYKKKKD